MGITKVFDLISGEFFIFNKSFDSGAPSGTTVHNDLDGLNDGDYIHLTQSEKNKFNQFDTYTGNTELEINNINEDIIYLSGQTYTGDTYYAWDVVHISGDVQMAEPNIYYIINAESQPINITIPDAIQNDVSEYKFILEKNTHKVRIESQSSQLIGNYPFVEIATVSGGVHIKANDDHFDIIDDTRILESVVEITTDRDFTDDGVENYILYICKPEGGVLTLTLPEPSDPNNNKSINAKFLLEGEGSVSLTTASGVTLIGDSTVQTLSITGTSFRLIEANNKYYISDDSRPKALNIPISTYPLNEVSNIIDPLTGNFFNQRCQTIEDPRYDKETTYYNDTVVSSTSTYQILNSAISDENIFIGIVPEGLIDSSFIAARIGSGFSNITAFVRYSKWDSLGNETLIAESNNIILNSSTLTLQETVALHSGFTMNDGDRIVVRVLGIRGGFGGNPTFRVAIEGPVPSRSRIEVPVNTITHNSLVGLNVGDLKHLTAYDKKVFDELLNVDDIKTVTGDTSLTLADYTILVDASLGNINIDLISAVNNKGKIYNIKKIDSSINNVIINTIGNQTIDGDLSKNIIQQWEKISIQSNNNNWYII